MRLFTPYKRRRRAREPSEGETPSRKHKSDNSRDGSNNEESDAEVGVVEKEVWPQYVSADGIVVHQAPDQDTVIQSVHHAENGQSVDDMFKKLDEVSSKMLKLAYEFRKTLEETKEASRQQRREQALVAQLGTRGEVVETVGLQPSSGTHNKKVLYHFINNDYKNMILFYKFQFKKRDRSESYEKLSINMDNAAIQ